MDTNCSRLGDVVKFYALQLKLVPKFIRITEAEILHFRPTIAKPMLVAVFIFQVVVFSFLA